MRTQKFGNRAIPAHPGAGDDKEHQKLVTQAEKWVAQTFYGEMLKQMRKSPFKSETFSGGRGGEAFQEMFDQKIADKMSKGAGGKLVDSLVKSLEKKAHKAYQAASKTFKKTDAMIPPKVVAFRGVA
jgi:Rod binding domain-containing protein